MLCKGKISPISQHYRSTLELELDLVFSVSKICETFTVKYLSTIPRKCIYMVHLSNDILENSSSFLLRC